VLELLDWHVEALRDGRRAGGDVAGAGHVRLVERDLLRARAHDALNRAVRAVARSHVRGGAVWRAVAVGSDAGVDLVDAERLPVLVVDGALDDAEAAHDADDLVGLDQLVSEARDLRRVGLLLV